MKIRKCKPSEMTPDKSAKEQKYCLLSNKGRLMGRHKTYKGAEEQERAILTHLWEKESGYKLLIAQLTVEDLEAEDALDAQLAEVDQRMISAVKQMGFEPCNEAYNGLQLIWCLTSGPYSILLSGIIAPQTESGGFIPANEFGIVGILFKKGKPIDTSVIALPAQDVQTNPRALLEVLSEVDGWLYYVQQDQKVAQVLEDMGLKQEINLSEVVRDPPSIAKEEGGKKPKVDKEKDKKIESQMDDQPEPKLPLDNTSLDQVLQGFGVKPSDVTRIRNNIQKEMKKEYERLIRDGFDDFEAREIVEDMYQESLGQSL